MASWKRTGISLEPPSYAVSHLDREALTIDANEPIIDADVTAVKVRLRSDASDIIVGVEILSEGCVVIIEGMEQGVDYEMLVTFTRPDSRRWSRTLVIECVA